MIRRICLGVVAVLTACPLVAQSTKPEFTFDDVLQNKIDLRPTWNERWEWAQDGEHLVRIRGEERAWFEARSGKAIESLPSREAEPEPEPEAGRRRRDRRPTVALPAPANAEFPTASPDKASFAFVEKNDLFVCNTADGDVLARTTDGGESQFNGKLDWVYQEEIYGRGRFQAFWWSPDSKHVAFLSLDESPVNTFTVVDHIETGHFRVKPEVTHYPKSGDPNPLVRLGVLSTDGTLDWIDLSRFDGTEPLVVRVEWSPDGKLLYTVQDRIQSWAELLAWDPGTKKSSVWIRESSESWVDRPESPHWLTDGSFLWESNRTGYRHLYHYDANGFFQRVVTKGDWQVTGIESIDEVAGTLRFRGTKHGAAQRHTYLVDLESLALVHLTPGKGQHTLRYNDGKTLAIDTFNSLENPGTVQLVDLATGDVLRELATASSDKWDATGLPKWRSLQVPTRDGLLLDGALLPPKLAPGQTKAPLWISTYSGPDAPTVRDRWNSSGWFAFLASQGIGVFQLNVRTASGMGHWAIEQCYRQLGVVELRDFSDALDWLAKEESWFDPKRVGMTGYSYGGFMTAFALTHSDRFALGIAGGGVYDWGLYDTIYTERYMSTPQLNPDGYARTSVLKAAHNLSGHLLITHGVMDDNVHVQNAMQLIYALQQAGKSFELMLYPQTRHGIRNRAQRTFDRRLNWRAIQSHLLP